MRNFICLALCVFLLVLFPPAMGAGNINDPAAVSQLNVDITQSGNIMVSRGAVGLAMINITAPQNTATQTVSSTQKTGTNALGSEYFEFLIENPGMPIVYSTESQVSVRSQRTKYLPETYNLPQEVLLYLEPTDTIQSDDPAIKALADSIVEGSQDDFEKVARLSGWVTENTEYDLAYGTKAYDALWVMEHKTGTCDEFATLFIALARSQGIPARYVSGWAYGESGWEPHAYAEVYLGVWVPVDPTWNEVGHLDATHIKFSVQASNEVSNNVRVTGRNVGDIVWVEDTTDIEITSFEEDEKAEQYELIKSAEILEAGDDAVVVLKFMPDEYKVVRVSLIPCTGSYGIASVDKKEKNIILRPGKEAVVYWTVHINPSLPKSMIFTCPLTLNSRLLKTRSINLVADTAKQHEKTNTNLFAEVSAPLLTLGDEQEIYLSLKGTTGNDVIYVGVVADEDVLEQTTIGDASMTFRFMPKKTGSNEAVVYTSTGIVKKLSFNVTNAGDIFIQNVELKDAVRAGDSQDVTVTINNSRKNAQSMRFQATADGADSVQMISFSGTKNMTVPLAFRDIGINKVRFSISGDGFEHSVTRQIEVYDVPEVDIKTGYDYDRQEGIITVIVGKYRADDVTVIVAGNELELGSFGGARDAKANVSLGNYKAEVRYKDASGKEYVFEKDISFAEDNILQMILRWFAGFFSGMNTM